MITQLVEGLHSYFLGVKTFDELDHHPIVFPSSDDIRDIAQGMNLKNVLDLNGHPKKYLSLI